VVIVFRSISWFGLLTFVPLYEVSLGHSKAHGNHLLSLMLLAGGAGTVLGPLLGALVVRLVGEAAKRVAGDAPGVDLAIYGMVLIAVVAFAPRGIVGLIANTYGRLRRLPPQPLAGGLDHG